MTNSQEFATSKLQLGCGHWGTGIPFSHFEKNYLPGVQDMNPPCFVGVQDMNPKKTKKKKKVPKKKKKGPKSL
jgi:hypothetical protein